MYVNRNTSDCCRSIIFKNYNNFLSTVVLVHDMDGTSRQSDKFVLFKSIKTKDGASIDLPTKQFHVKMLSQLKSDSANLNISVSTICFCSSWCLLNSFIMLGLKTVQWQILYISQKIQKRLCDLE